MENVDETEVAKWRSGTPLEWAEESFAIARDVIYARSRGPSREDDPIVLSADYAAEAKHQVSRRLAMAGIRLAWLLERLLAN